jgi:putative methyltransferase (TIGR04325 family)
VALKQLIRSIVPSKLYQAAHDMKVRISLSPSGQAADEGAPSIRLSYSPRPSFAEAARECGKGYGADKILEKAHRSPHAWLTQMQEYAAPLLASFAVAATTAGNQRLKVLDFGGGIGIFKAYVNDFFDHRIQTDWKVVEVPEQVAHNSDVAQEGLNFSTSIGEEFFDIAVFSGSLQYVDDWRAPLQEASAQMIFISRTAIGDVDQPYIQTIARNGHVAKVPARVVPRPELFALLSENYDLFASWDFKSHLVEMGLYQSPAMLWRRKRA